MHRKRKDPYMTYGPSCACFMPEKKHRTDDHLWRRERAIFGRPACVFSAIQKCYDEAKIRGGKWVMFALAAHPCFKTLFDYWRSRKSQINIEEGHNMKKMIGYCGLDCEKCDAYLATINDDQALREKTAKLWAELNQAPILPEHIHCQGCRVDGVKTIFCDKLCAIRQCALKKGMATCGNCADLESCSTVRAILENDPSALANLKG